MQDGHKGLSWFGQKKTLRPAGGENLYYLAPKCLYRGEYKKDSMRVLSLSAEKRCMQVVFFVSYVVRCLSSLASASPFIVQGEAQGYRV